MDWISVARQKIVEMRGRMRDQRKLLKNVLKGIKNGIIEKANGQKEEGDEELFGESR